jgi:uncharacterized protein DUF4396
MRARPSAGADRQSGPHGAHQGSGEPRSLTRLAAVATAHCLTGCAIGEVAGLAIGTALGWGDLDDDRPGRGARLPLRLRPDHPAAAALGPALAAVLPIALAAETISIAIMEVVDNAVMLVIPGHGRRPRRPALLGPLAAALAIAFLAAWPVNRWLIARGRGHAVVRGHH